MATFFGGSAARRAVGAAALAGLLMTGSSGVHAQALVVAVVVHPANAETQLSSAELCDTLRGERTRWADSSLIQVLVPPSDSPEWAVVVRAVCHASVAGFRRQVATSRPFGRASRPPVVAATAAEMKTAVAASPRAIGFLAAPQVDGTLKALSIDGKAPTDPAYPLQKPGKQESR